MTNKTILAAALSSLLVMGAGTANAQEKGVKLGQLNCVVEGGVGFIFGSSKALNCTFTPASSEAPEETYTGSINKFGIDIGFTGKSVITWTVVSADADKYQPKALEGTYSGASASAAFVAGLGANVLVGGSDKSFALQPLSVSAGTGVNAAVGVAQITLR